MRIEITKEDCLSFAVEGIVNSANDMLVFGSGIAGQMGAAGGEQLRNALDEILARYKGGPLPLGIAVDTPAFGIGVPGITQHIIHAVSLGSRKFASPDGRLLATVQTVRDSVLAARRLAESLGCRSLVYPVMLSRPGYSVVDTDPKTLRWVMACALVLGITTSEASESSLERIYISVYNTDPALIELDTLIFETLLREPTWGRG